MALEIERKFLVQSETWRTSVTGVKLLQQGYIVRTELLPVSWMPSYANAS